MCKNSIRQKLSQHRNFWDRNKRRRGWERRRPQKPINSASKGISYQQSEVNEWIRQQQWEFISKGNKNGHINGTLTKCRKTKSRISLWTEKGFIGHLKCRLLYFRMHILLMSLTHYATDTKMKLYGSFMRRGSDWVWIEQIEMMRERKLNGNVRVEGLQCEFFI